MEVRGVLLKGPDAPYVCSQVINGGWQLSAGHHPGRKEEDAILADLAAYHGGGITTFDMGDIYTGVEALVGQLVRSKRRSGEGAASLVQIHTKFVPDLDALLTIDAVHIRAVLARSCRRVGVVKLDLVQFHWWILEVGDFCATAKLLAQVGLEEGYARRIGLTNFSCDDTAAMLDSAVPIASTQVQYSLLDRRVEARLVPMLEARRRSEDGRGGASEPCGEPCGEPSDGVLLLCYGVLAGGFLTKRWLGCEEPTMETLAAEHNRSLVKYKLVIDAAGGWSVLQTLLRAAQVIATRHEATIAQVAMAWVLRQRLVASIIIGTRDAKWLPSTRAACTLARALDESELATLRTIGVAPLPGAVYELERDRSKGAWGEVMHYNLNQLLSASHVAEHAAALDAVATSVRSSSHDALDTVPSLSAAAFAALTLEAWLLEREAAAFAQFQAQEMCEIAAPIEKARAQLNALWEQIVALGEREPRVAGAAVACARRRQRAER